MQRAVALSRSQPMPKHAALVKPPQPSPPPVAQAGVQRGGGGGPKERGAQDGAAGGGGKATGEAEAAAAAQTALAAGMLAGRMEGPLQVLTSRVVSSGLWDSDRSGSGEVNSEPQGDAGPGATIIGAKGEGGGGGVGGGAVEYGMEDVLRALAELRVVQQVLAEAAGRSTY